MGVITEVTVRILRRPVIARAVLLGFSELEAAGDCVGAIIGAGIIPGGMEMMDKPAIHATEEFVQAGYPLDAEALLIVELDGPQVEVDHLIDRVEEIARGLGADYMRISENEKERELFWPAEKMRSRQWVACHQIITVWTGQFHGRDCRRLSLG